LDIQAESIGVPHLKVRVTEGTNNEYEKQMEAVLLQAKSEGINNVIYGDIFLDDLKIYRESNLAKVGMKSIFPIWKMDTKILSMILSTFNSKLLFVVPMTDTLVKNG